MTHTAEIDAGWTYGTGRLKDRSLALNFQADKCGGYLSLTAGRRHWYLMYQPRTTATPPGGSNA